VRTDSPRSLPALDGRILSADDTSAEAMESIKPEKASLDPYISFPLVAVVSLPARVSVKVTSRIGADDGHVA
jgi:hypothetical protein